MRQLFGRPKVVFANTITKYFYCFFNKNVVKHNIGRPRVDLVMYFSIIWRVLKSDMRDLVMEQV